MLNQDQIEHYFDKGYVLVPSLFEQVDLSSWSAYFEKLVLGQANRCRGMVLMKDVEIAKGSVEPKSPLHAINKLLNFEDDPVLYDYVKHPRLIEAAQSLIGTGLYSLVTNVFNKPPYVDGRHPLHQDLRYFRMRPAEKIVAAWTAISPCTRDNGCLAVVPGSHHQGIRDHKLPEWDYVNFAFYGIKELEGVEHIHLEMDPGDTVLFHPLLVHGSGRNNTDGFRQAISAHFASHECESPAPDWRENDRVRRIPGS